MARTTSQRLRDTLKSANANACATCKHPACNRATFRPDGFCSDECNGTVESYSLQGAGVVTPPAKVIVTNAQNRKQRRTRASEGYVAKNGAWRAIEPAPYWETLRDAYVSPKRKTRERNRVQASVLQSIKRDIALQATMGVANPNAANE